MQAKSFCKHFEIETSLFMKKACLSHGTVCYKCPFNVGPQ